MVDRRDQSAHSGTIAVTAASCSEGVYGIQAVLPGKGVVIVQASSNGDARAAALKMLDEGVPLDTILARISDPASGYSPERQQYVRSRAATMRGRAPTPAPTCPARKGS